MRKRSSVSLGPGASSLILIFVVLSMSVLGMLSLMTSRNDLRMSERAAQVVEAVYRLNEQAEERRAALDAVLAACAADAADENAYLTAVAAALPDGVSLDGDQLSWLESDGSRVISCAVRVLPLGGERREEWIRHDLTAETEDEWN